jgi:hypothetical protein
MKRAFAFAFLIISTSASAGNQDDAPPIAKAATRSQDEVEFSFYRSVFSRWMPVAMKSQKSETAIINMARANLSSQLILRIDDIDRQVSLTEDQKKKLLASGQLDVRRFFDRIEQVKDNYLRSKSDQLKLREILSDYVQLKVDFQVGLFGPGSFFSKVSRKTLDEEQLNKLRRSQEQRIRSRWKTQALIMARAWGDGVGMSNDQTVKFSELIVAEIPPPTMTATLDYYYILYRLDQLPRTKLRPIFDDAQWKVFNRQIAQIKTAEKNLLIQWGYNLGDAKKARPEPEPAK